MLFYGCFAAELIRAAMMDEVWIVAMVIDG